jgi:hypothetical protein
MRNGCNPLGLPLTDAWLMKINLVNILLDIFSLNIINICKMPLIYSQIVRKQATADYLFHFQSTEEWNILRKIFFLFLVFLLWVDEQGLIDLLPFHNESLFV